jgi:hypothetical protein
MAYFPWMVSLGDSKCFTGTRLKGRNDTTCSQIGGCASQAAGDDYTHASFVRLWHLADNPTAPTFVRFWTIADIARFFWGPVCPLKTRSGQTLMATTPSATARASGPKIGRGSDQGVLPRIDAGWPGSLSDPTGTSLLPTIRSTLRSLSPLLPTYRNRPSGLKAIPSANVPTSVSPTLRTFLPSILSSMATAWSWS